MIDKMIDNFDKMISIMSFEDTNDFYFVQLIKRKKDNPDMKGDSVVIKEWFVSSVDYFLDKKESMIDMADKYNARLTIRVNKRNYKKLGLKMIADITQKLESENYKGLKSSFSSVAGQYPSDSDKKWIVDIDQEDLKDLEDIKKVINNSMPDIDKIICEIPSKSGIHLIVRPFDIREFKKLFNVEIKKDNPTNLYIR
jgi:predicted HicB family RNase H-like nuclease